MRVKYISKKFENMNNLLSATKPLEGLSLNKNLNAELKLVQKIKQILKVYIEPESNKKLVEAGAAYALGITKVRALLLDSPRYYEITGDVIKRLEERDYEIQYINLPPKQKQKIQIFYEDNKYYVNMSAAFALGYVDIKTFYESKEMYVLLTNEQLDNIKYNFIVEFEKIKENNETPKTL